MKKWNLDIKKNVSLSAKSLKLEMC